MARKIKALAQHGGRKYPWEEWLDGSAWELVVGTDFAVTIESFRSTAIGKARDMGGKLHTRVVKDGKALQIQFYKEKVARHG